MKKLLAFVCSFLVVLFPLFAQETFTLTTYYPAPFGVYTELRSRRMAVGNNYFNPALYPWDTDGNIADNEISQDANLVLEGNMGIGTTNPQTMLHVVGDYVPVGPSNPLNQGGVIRLSSTDGSRAIQMRIGAAVDLESIGANLVINRGSCRATGNIDVNNCQNIVMVPDLAGPTVNPARVGIGTANPQAKLDVAGGVKIGTVADNACGSSVANDEGIVRYDSANHQMEYCDGTDWRTGGGGGPRFITPVVVYSGQAETNWTPFNASSYIPASATAVILEIECAISGPDIGVSDVDAHVRIRMNSASSSYLLMRARSAGEGDHMASANQGVYPIPSTRTFEYIVEPPGFDFRSHNIVIIRLIGYY